MPERSPGQAAYEAWFDSMENTAPAGSLRWQALEPRERDAWEAAAQAVLALRPPAGVDRDATPGA